jgi:hypothetical protein
MVVKPGGAGNLELGQAAPAALWQDDGDDPHTSPTPPRAWPTQRRPPVASDGTGALRQALLMVAPALVHPRPMARPPRGCNWGCDESANSAETPPIIPLLGLSSIGFAGLGKAITISSEPPPASWAQVCGGWLGPTRSA